MLWLMMPFLLVFAKQNIKNVPQKAIYLFYNKVFFARKHVPLYLNIRLLKRDKWILLDEEPMMPVLARQYNIDSHVV